MLPEDPVDCTGCVMTYDLQATAQVPTTGGNYAFSGVNLSGQSGDRGRFLNYNMPSGSYFVLYDPVAEQSVKIFNPWVVTDNGKCSIQDGDCKQETQCEVWNIYLFVANDAELANGDLAFRINGGGVHLAREVKTDPDDPANSMPGFSIIVDTKVDCGSDLTVEIEYVPNNSTLPLPPGTNNFATGMKFTFHCGKCVGTEDPI
jgi:hypothetical protein